MEHTSRCHKKNASRKRKDRWYIFAPQPGIAQKDRAQVYGQHVTDKDVEHRHLRQQAADQDIRPQEAIVGKLIPIAAPAELKPGREERMLFQACIPYRPGKGSVLAEPVRIGAEDSALRHGQDDQYKKENNER